MAQHPLLELTWASWQMQSLTVVEPLQNGGNQPLQSGRCLSCEEGHLLPRRATRDRVAIVLLKVPARQAVVSEACSSLH